MIPKHLNWVWVLIIVIGLAVVSLTVQVAMYGHPYPHVHSRTTIYHEDVRNFLLPPSTVEEEL